jgi:Flp pilus assembly protein TadD
MSAPAAPQGEPRTAELAPALIDALHAAARAIRDGHAAQAAQALQRVLAAAPDHPEALRLWAILQLRSRRPGLALPALERALSIRPDDAMLHNDLGSVRGALGDADAALASWRRATALDPQQPMPWFNLGRNLQQQGRTTEAIEALERVCALAPELLPATILLGDALAHLGRFDQAEARYRAALALHPACGDAWRGLSNIKTRPLDDGDIAMLAKLLHDPATVEADRIAMGHALGKAEEDRGRYPEAFAAIAAANALTRRRAPWSVEAFERFVREALHASESLPDPIDPGLGCEVVFIVGLPRSGSTLFEQILAAHPEVEGAGELPDLGLLVQAESQRRSAPYPQWSAAADAHDWHRLGRDYLARTARWRASRPRMADKMPENWKHAGILRAMLPGATVIDVRRDPLETGWSCFKQQFYQLPHFSCDLVDIGAYLRGCEQAMDVWRARDPDRIHLFRYEALLADPEAEIRRLLDACGLAFDPACLQFHRVQRSVRTASAAQVRQPLQAGTARAVRYGALLDPLRAALQGPALHAPAQPGPVAGAADAAG